MKNGIIAIVVIATAGGVGVFLSSRETEKELISIDPGGVLNTDALLEDVARKKTANDAELQSKLPVPSLKGPWPKAVADETTYDFGSMQVGAELEHVFTIRNEGDSELNLLAGKSTCKCTAFELSKTQLQKGEESKLTVRWIGKFRDEKFQHGGPVYTDDPEHKKINFAVKGNVDNAIEILPADVWSVGHMADGATGNMTTFLVSRLYDDFKLLSVEPESPFVNVDVSPMTQKQITELSTEALSGFSLSVEVLPDVPVGPFESRIVMEVDRLEEPVTVNVTATRAGPIEIQQSPGVLWIPSANGLKLGQFSAQKGCSAELVLVVNEEELDGELKLEKVAASPAYLKAELRLVRKLDDNRGRYSLNIIIPPGISKGSFNRDKSAKLVLKTNHPKNPDLTINVSYKAF